MSSLSRRSGASIVTRLNRQWAVPKGSLLSRSISLPLKGWASTQTRPGARSFASVSEVPHPNATTSLAVTPIEQLVLDTIKLTGPISFAKYMSLCLSHPTHGYYMNPAHAVFGTSGDFITSPEISQVFGELTAIWLITQWAAAGSPQRVRIVELGPGRGTLMDDMLRVLQKFLPSDGLTSVHLVETSEALRATQSKKLGCFQDSTGGRNSATLPDGKVRVEWHDSLSEIERSEDVYTMLVAHEFFDALPVHVVQKTETGWNEIMIASTEPSSSSLAESKQQGSSALPSSTPSPTRSFAKDSIPTESQARLRRVLNPLPSPISTLLGNSSSRFRSLPEGTNIEVSPTSFRIAHQIGRLLSGWDAEGLLKEGGGQASEPKPTNEPTSEDPSSTPQPPPARGHGGAALIIDYGSSSFHTDSLRAFKSHRMVDLFHEPGQCDITADVDFEYLKEGMGGLVNTHGPVSQGTFLNRMAIGGRVASLVQNAPTDERQKAIKEAAERLVDENGMGGQYKVLGVVGGGSAGGNGSGELVVWPFINEHLAEAGSRTGPQKDGEEGSQHIA